MSSSTTAGLAMAQIESTEAPLVARTIATFQRRTRNPIISHRCDNLDEPTPFHVRLARKAIDLTIRQYCWPKEASIAST